jgi:hypothetical protein
MGPEIGTCIGIDASVVWMSSSLNISTEEYPTIDVPLSFMPFSFL